MTAQEEFAKARTFLADDPRVDAGTTVLVDVGWRVSDAREAVLNVLAADLIATARELNATDALEGAPS